MLLRELELQILQQRLGYRGILILANHNIRKACRTVSARVRALQLERIHPRGASRIHFGSDRRGQVTRDLPVYLSVIQVFFTAGDANDPAAWRRVQIIGDRDHNTDRYHLSIDLRDEVG